ncbi:NAD(P)-binding protein [Jaminaea rosea]|uniref:NAD(P)-binding protein n=1 Tax=Jaminaea rosea TaxID=1569628 RepID=A0A316UKX2_9BASI|nr:NAD(P)-binding protein [Jaminaea rosea]PWN25952.1 NAD(P)-binding protein [Jaminaea rosea]
MSSILVTGATGKQGQATLAALAQAQVANVKALTRNPSGPRGQALSQDYNAQPVKGDLNDKASLQSAMSGASAAFLVTTFDDAKGTDGEVEKGKIFVDAALASPSVKHIVFSSVGSASSAPSVPHFASKAKIEDYLKAQWKGENRTWTIVRPVAFFDNFDPNPGMARFGALSFFGSLLGNTKVDFIAVEDIGRVAALALQSPQKFHGQTIELASQHLSTADIQKAIPGGAWKMYIPPFILFKILPYDLSQMFKWFVSDGYHGDLQAVRKQFPFLLTFEQWAKKGQDAAAAKKKKA